MPYIFCGKNNIDEMTEANNSIKPYQNPSLLSRRDAYKQSTDKHHQHDMNQVIWKKCYFRNSTDDFDFEHFLFI